MPFAIPAIATFIAAGSTVAGVAALAGTFTGFMSVAGAALSLVGGLTGKKDLMKIGGLMSLGGGLATAFNSLSSGASAAAGSESLAANAADASPAWDAAGSAAGSDAAQFGKYASIDGVGASNPGMLGSNPFGGEIGQAASSPVSDLLAQPVDPQGMAGKSLVANQPPNQPQSSWFDKIGENINKNKELYKIGGSMLQGMYGPEAQNLDLQKELIARRRRNLNYVVPMGNG